MSYTLKAEVVNPLISLLYIPSFYGAFSWGIWLILYLMQLVKLNEYSGESIAIFISVELFFVVSTIVSYPVYWNKIVAKRKLPVREHPTEQKKGRMKRVLLLLHAIGFIGLLTWLVHIAGYLGGFDLVLFALLNAADAIRGATDLSTTIGIQISFIGWIAIALTIFAVAKKQISKWWLVLALLQLAGNFLYIGRAQPIWIMFTSLLMALISYGNITLKKAIIWLGVILIVFVSLFWAVGVWTGKAYYEDKFEDAVIPGMTQVIYAYGVSGFAYFNHMLVNNEPIAYKPERVFYPLVKLFARFGLAEEPPSQLLEFYDVPFETNVGTFLEPFYRDGGLLFVLIGALIYSFGLDALGLLLLKSGEPLAFYAWANLCFTTFMGFFTPQITQFPVWMFVGLGLASLLIKTYNANIVEGNTSRA